VARLAISPAMKFSNRPEMGQRMSYICYLRWLRPLKYKYRNLQSKASLRAGSKRSNERMSNTQIHKTDESLEMCTSSAKFGVGRV